jgi:hypothetical protein
VLLTAAGGFLWYNVKPQDTVQKAQEALAG